MSIEGGGKFPANDNEEPVNTIVIPSDVPFLQRVEIFLKIVHGMQERFVIPTDLQDELTNNIAQVEKYRGNILSTSPGVLAYRSLEQALSNLESICNRILKRLSDDAKDRR